MRRNANGANGKKHATQQSLNGAIKSVCDVTRYSNCAGVSIRTRKSKRTRARRMKILDLIEAKQKEITEAIAKFRAIG
jgi:hypothetical protein